MGVTFQGMGRWGALVFPGLTEAWQLPGDMVLVEEKYLPLDLKAAVTILSRQPGGGSPVTGRSLSTRSPQSPSTQ